MSFIPTIIGTLLGVSFKGIKAGLVLWFKTISLKVTVVNNPIWIIEKLGVFHNGPLRGVDLWTIAVKRQSHFCQARRLVDTQCL